MFKVLSCPPYYCLMKKGKKTVCFKSRTALVHHWGTKVNIYDDEELRAYSDLCQKMFKNDQEEHSY